MIPVMTTEINRQLRDRDRRIEQLLEELRQRNIPKEVREWMEEALDLLEQPGLEYTNRERRETAIADGYSLLDSLPEPEPVPPGNVPDEELPTAPEPDWSDAPDNATHWAVDGYQNASGWWEAWFYVGEPKMWQSDMGWDGPKRIHADQVILPIGIDWRTTLRKRPEAAHD